ncbi:hypothetical protein [Dietzia timorensis]|uniref:Uncharacterized protein n=1 Tax=Dietzia timorensis TaxID=499555 RepID=A0A173LJW8_9ACTN|nr:hypothetical protein [Dietzia timorensis]ANI91751.1 Uncharacterized protein BJL86_0958 [Dietzia timorensis]
MVSTATVDRMSVESGSAEDTPDRDDSGAGNPRALTVAELRKKVAAVSGGSGAATSRMPSRGAVAATVSQFPADAGIGAGADSAAVQNPTAPALPASAPAEGAGTFDRGVPADVVPLPRDLRSVVPSGAVAPGQVVALAGGHSLVVALVAAATAAGKRCAIVGYPALGLAAVAAEGGDLSQVALVPSAGADPGVVTSVLLDGMDMVVLDPACGRIPPARARVLAGRARSAGTVLVAGARDWPGAELHLEATPSRCAGLDRGYGRIFSACAPVLARGKLLGGAGARGELTLHGCPSRSVAGSAESAAPMRGLPLRDGVDVAAPAAERRVG